MIRNLLIIFTLIASIQSVAQTGTITVDKQRILIGEPIRITLQVKLARTVDSINLAIDSLPHFELLDSSALIKKEDASELTLEKSYTITSWDSGLWVLSPPMPTAFTTEPIRIKVDWTSPFDTAQPYHDIKDIVPVEKETEPKWYWYLIGLGLLLILFLLFFPRGKKDQAQKPRAPSVDAYKEAILRLQDLRSKELDRSDIKQYYSNLIFILRDYLHKRKGIYSHSKTTDDLSIQMKQLKLPAAFYNELVQTLRLSDLAKYAKYQPLAEENKKAFEVIVQTIKDIERGNAV